MGTGWWVHQTNEQILVERVPIGMKEAIIDKMDWRKLYTIDGKRELSRARRHSPAGMQHQQLHTQLRIHWVVQLFLTYHLTQDRQVCQKRPVLIGYAVLRPLGGDLSIYGVSIFFPEAFIWDLRSRTQHISVSPLLLLLLYISVHRCRDVSLCLTVCALCGTGASSTKLLYLNMAMVFL